MLTDSVNLMALFEGVPPLAQPLVGKGALGLEPHALHLIQVVYGWHPLLGKAEYILLMHICIIYIYAVSKVKQGAKSSVFGARPWDPFTRAREATKTSQRTGETACCGGTSQTVSYFKCEIAALLHYFFLGFLLFVLQLMDLSN